MKHVYVGVAAALLFLIAFGVWATLGLLVGPLWGTIVLLLTVGVGVAVGLIDYATERGSE